MSPEVEQIALTVMILLVVVLVPMVPSITIYRLFPKDQVMVSGPFQGLTIQAAGAFAAYFVTFLAMTPFAWRTFNVATATISPAWTIRGDILFVDTKGNPIPDQGKMFEQLQLTLKPNPFSATGGKLRIKVPEIDRRVPTLHLELPTFGSETLDLSNEKLGVERDESTREISLEKVIVIRPNLASAGQYQPAGGQEAYLQPVSGQADGPR